MLSRHLYYSVKPFLPWGLRMGIRRWFALRKRTRPEVQETWPILPGSEKVPEGWPGWPDGKQFAFVLTHDVEGPDGLAKVKPLAELEMRLGFRSCFNFIPEGGYRVPDELRTWLVNNGFEVGVHDLYHDGKLFSSHSAFRQRAPAINRYLKDWGAVGFRSGFMLHNLEWLHDLEIGYDASTFDTDPFEPQPQGRGTIFPFWVPRPGSDHSRSDSDDSQSKSGKQKTKSGNLPSAPGTAPSDFPLSPSSSGIAPSGFQLSAFNSQLSPAGSQVSPSAPGTAPAAFPLSAFTSQLSPSGSQVSPSASSISAFRFPLSAFPPPLGYVELPYTLPQDSTLFLLLKETSPEIWLRKLDWIAQHGGMALVNVHPDYLCLNGSPARPWEVSLGHYERLLRHVAENYSGADWRALPREVAAMVRDRAGDQSGAGLPVHSTGATDMRRKPKIWIDLDNTPHVPLFEPIIEELKARGYPVVVTARDAFQVCELASKKHLPVIRVGRHYGKNRLLKGWGLFYRAVQLSPTVLRERPVLGVFHGARSQLIIGNLLRVPTLLIEDYEHAQFPWMTRPDHVLVPKVIGNEHLPVTPDRVYRYDGIKEDVYAWSLQPDPMLLASLGIEAGEIVVTVRPPATEAHYHNPESERLFVAFMEYAMATPNVRVVLLPRNSRQGDTIRHRWPGWFARARTVVPGSAVDGMNLIWHSDLVVSGGGTMNREAAALGVPVYSIFRGTIGAVDHQLSREGRLTLIQSVAEVTGSIRLQKRSRKDLATATSQRTLHQIVDVIVETAVRESYRH